MIIKALGRILISLMFMTFVLNNNIIQSLPPQNNTTNTETFSSNIAELNKLIKNSSENLDKISSVLEFTAQAISRGSIVLPNKAATRRWVKTHQNNIKILEKALADDVIDMEKIFKVNYISKFLIAHIYNQLEDSFQNIQGFEIDLDAITFTRSQSSKITSKTTKQLIDFNLKRILKLQEKANEIGLTFINKTTRMLEELNDKYQITRLFGIIPPLLFLTSAGFYYTPLSWFDQTSFLGKLKTKIFGGSKHTDPAYNPHPTINNGILHKILTVWEKDSGKLSLAFSALAAYANRDSLATTFPQAGEFFSAMRDSWQRLKGYEVKSSARYTIIEDITLDDERIIGLGTQKQKLQHTLEYIANPDMYDRQHSGPGKAILINGPSGNGKTLLAKALAGSLNKLLRKKGSNNRIAFKEIKWAEIAWTRDGLKKVVEQAKPHAPCILFFDEIHTLPLQTKEGSPTLSDFLVELDGVNKADSASSQIIFVAATNQAEMLDKALIRSGRFGTIITVEKPNFETRKQYFEVMCKHYSIDTATLDLDLLSRQTADCSFSDLDSILKDARFVARSEIRRTNQKHIQDRIIESIYRLKEDLTLTDFEKKHLAANKAGSALMYLLLNPQEMLEIVTIKGRWKKIKEGRYWDNEVRQKVNNARNIKYGAIFTYNPNEALRSTNEEEKIKQCKIMIAGYLAEEVLLKTRRVQQNNKYEKNALQKNKLKALELIRSMHYETSEESYMPRNLIQELKEKTYQTFKNYEAEVKALLEQHQSLLATIAKELEEKELLTLLDLKELMTNAS